MGKKIKPKEETRKPNVRFANLDGEIIITLMSISLSLSFGQIGPQEMTLNSEL